MSFKPKYQCAIAHSNLGDVFQQEGQGERAIEHYKKALSYNPYVESAHSNLGVAYIQRGFIVMIMKTTIELLVRDAIDREKQQKALIYEAQTVARSGGGNEILIEDSKPVQTGFFTH